MRGEVFSGVLGVSLRGGAAVRVVLIGYRGTGKTSVGRILAESLNLPFFDTDMLVERTAGVSIPEIFRQHGEARFRALERGVIESLAGVEGVISTGGGAVCDPANVADLRRHGRVYLLSASPETIGERIAGSDRPGLTDLPPEEEVRSLLARRRTPTLAPQMPVWIPVPERRLRLPVSSSGYPR